MFSWWETLLGAAAVVLVLRQILTMLAGRDEPVYVEHASQGVERGSRDRDDVVGTARSGNDELPSFGKEATYPKELTFALQGEKAKGGLVERGSRFSLCFEYRPPSSDMLAILRSTGLRAAIAANADVEIAIVPGRLTVVDGVYLKVARFRDDTLTNDVRFELLAPDSPVDDAGVHVFVSVSGCLLYDFPLEIRVVKNLDAALAIDLATHVPILDLDAMAKVKDARAPRDVRLVFSKDGADIDVLFHAFDKPEIELKLKRIDAATWANLLRETAADVREVAAAPFWNTLSDPLKVPDDKVTRESVRQARNKMISAGSTLYRKLTRDGNLAFVLDQIERLDAGSRVSVLSDCGFLPLEILYPDDYHYTSDTPPTTSRLWGYRFKLEYLLYEASTSAALPADSAPRSAPFVSFNLDPFIDEQLKQPGFKAPPFLPVAAHDALANDIRTKGWKVERNGELATIQATFQAAHAATLLYYYCHGKSDAPFAADPVSKLAFGTAQIDPSWIQRIPPFRHAPVVVLNSCSSGEAGPLSFLSFLEGFRGKGASGVVSTWFAIPMLFASAFGREFVARYAASQPIGDALYDLRRELLDQDHPLGLFYALQCPMDLKAPAVEKAIA